MKSFVIQRLLFPLVRLYWRVLRQRTFGVKAVVVAGVGDRVLLVRHAYGDTAVWNLPGGGYRPTREAADVAVAREVREELGLRVTDSVELGEYRTQAQGKRDTVAVFVCQAGDGACTTNDEIAEARWFSWPEVAELDHPYAVTRRSFELYREYRSGRQ